MKRHTDPSRLLTHTSPHHSKADKTEPSRRIPLQATQLSQSMFRLLLLVTGFMVRIMAVSAFPAGRFRAMVYLREKRASSCIRSEFPHGEDA
jgi:hypothetical protein